MKNGIEHLSSRVINRGSIAGFELTENFYPANYQTPIHSHEYTYFCFVLEGDYTLEYRGRGHLCQPSKLLFFPGGANHACHVHTHSRCFNFQLNSRLLEYADLHYDIGTDHIVQKSRELSQAALRLYREMCSVDDFSELTVEALIAQITGEFLRHCENSSGNKAPDWLLTARDFLCDEFANHPSLSAVADLAEVHPTHLAREFKRSFHLTMGDFIRRRRVEFACLKLIQTNAPLKEVANEAGFFDQSHFTRVFKKATGMTPGAYRGTFRNC